LEYIYGFSTLAHQFVDAVVYDNEWLVISGFPVEEEQSFAKQGY
jgi:hypothetical protein